MALKKGSRVGKYEITGRLGGFGVGEVYGARDARLGREVAIKIIDPETEDLALVESAMSRAVTLYHPNIGSILEFNVGGELTYAVLEYYEGESLRQRFGRGRLPLRDCAMIGSDIALGLAAAHERGIAHGSLTPASVLVGFDGRLKILDFGMVATESSAALDANVEADCWALGKMLYEGATGELLDDGASDQLVHEVRLGLDRVGAPEAFTQVVVQCLPLGSKDERSAREIALELRSLLTRSEAMMTTIPTIRTYPIGRVGVILFVIAILLGIVLGFVFGGDGPSAP